MKKQLFPKEIIENSVEVHQFINSKKNQAVYIALIILFIGALLSLPFIKVNVYTSVRGIIKPTQERIPLRITQTGQVISTLLSPNATVAKGDTLLQLAHPVLDEKVALLEKQLHEHEKFIHDLTGLTKAPLSKNLSLLTTNYRKQWFLYRQGRTEVITKLQQAERNHKRNKQLFDKEVIPLVEYEQTTLAYELATNAVAQHQQNFLARWENELQEYTRQLTEQKSALMQLKQNQPQYVMIATTTGTLLIPEGIAPGNWVYAGQQLGELSPEGTLMVEAYVPSHKIGELFPYAPARFQVDAYNYHQWGTAKGSILSLGKDIELLNDQPIFKVRCSLDQTQLQLPNGAIGKLHKGLTLTALFYQNRRSLFDLLFDDINDWMNPNQPKTLTP